MTFLHSCQKAAELISQSLDEPLDLVDKLRLRVHLSMCGNCRNVQDQLNLIHKMGGQIGTIDVCDGSADVPLPHGNSAG
jgi:predicted anti-sigma-YlaC factor YlaD